MRNTDFITLKQCEIYSAHFPTDDVISRVENMRGHSDKYFYVGKRSLIQLTAKK
ncbi:hypothetical protein MY535_01295 [Haemophilus influenzae]|nr:hypothetical protein [Haemophilus influenzae]